MDADRFDAFVLSLDRAVPRRVALGGALGTGLTALLTYLGVEITEARRKKKKKKCKGGTKKCGKRCILASNCCANSDCGAGGGCVDGACLCFNGFKPCQGVCIADDECCGGCGEEICCKATCVDLATDAANCGACDNACASGVCIHGGCDCQSGGCPAGCSCGARAQGGAVCFGGVLAQACDEDDDCPLGSNCLTNLKCSKACVA